MSDQSSSPLDALRDQFDKMVAGMQTPQARKAAVSLGNVKSSNLGKAALRGHKRGDREATLPAGLC